jgi:phosphoglucomutase
LQVGVTTFGGFEVEVVDPIADYLATLKEVFDFGMLKAFVTRSDFSMVFDAMHAVTGACGASVGGSLHSS